MLTLYCRARPGAVRTVPAEITAPVSLPVPGIIGKDLAGLLEPSFSSPDRPLQTKTQAAIHPAANH